jgi:hypothetical protein
MLKTLFGAVENIENVDEVNINESVSESTSIGEADA